MRYTRMLLGITVISFIGIIGFYKNYIMTEYINIRRIIYEKLRPEDKPWSETWPIVSLKNCSHKEFMNIGRNSPENITIPRYLRTGLVSAPGSGNTWARHLIEQATGLWTGTVYSDQDPELYKAGFLGNNKKCKDNTTVVVKAHQPTFDKRKKCEFERVILIVRDSYRGLLAEFNRQKSKARSHTGTANDKLFLTKDWSNYIKTQEMDWADMTLQWIIRFKDEKRNLNHDQNPFVQPVNFWSRLLMVSYERLKQDPVKEVQRIVEFVRIPTFRKHCVEKDSDGKFKRNIQKTVEEVACLYSLNSEAQETVKKIVSNLTERSKDLGVGNIMSEFEGISEIKPVKNCTY